jgi:hypothetical protein
MAARFTQGDSIHTTRSTYQQNPPRNVKTRSESLKGGNTMSGMPGYINAHQTESMDHARGGKGVGPHREGPVGEKGGSGAKGMAKAEEACGTVTKSYHKSSTRKAGGLENSNAVGGTHVHTKEKTHAMPGQKPPPTSKGILGGTVRKAGIDSASHKEKNARAVGVLTGHRGRMERLSGTAKTHAEGRRKSVMY